MIFVNKKVSKTAKEPKRGRTMLDIVTVFKCGNDLPGKLSCYSFAEPTMADDKVEHLAVVDILEHHAVMMLVNGHPADVRLVGGW
jgi:hypothetical protein